MERVEFDYRVLWKPLAVAAAFAFLYAGVLEKLGYDWWTDENYSHGLLVPFVIAAIVWSARSEIRALAVDSSKVLAATLVTVAFILLLAGTLGAELFTQRASMIVMLGGIIAWFFGAAVMRFLAVPIALLALSVPIPQIIFNKIAFPLQLLASKAAVWGIRLFEVPTVRKGNVIEILPSGATQVIALEVVEACSGIRSLMTLVTLGLILVYFTRRDRGLYFQGVADSVRSFDLWRAILVMAAAVPIAVLTNAGRVTATGVLTYRYGMRALESTWHDVSGWLVYIVALGLLICVNYALMHLRRTPESNDEITGPGAGLTIANGKVVVVVAALVGCGLLVNWFSFRTEFRPDRRQLSDFPPALGDWKQKGDEIRFGEATESVLRVSDYTMREYVTGDGRIANIYVGYYATQKTGTTYHSPQNCLPGAGWEMSEPDIVEIPRDNGTSFTANRYIIVNGPYREIMIYWYQGRGRTESSEYRDKLNTIWDSVLTRRTDAALIRVMTSAGSDVEASTKRAVELSSLVAGRLPEYVPN